MFIVLQEHLLQSYLAVNNKIGYLYRKLLRVQKSHG